MGSSPTTSTIFISKGLKRQRRLRPFYGSVSKRSQRGGLENRLGESPRGFESLHFRKTKPALEKVWVFCLPRDENLGSALASTERAPLGVSVVSRLGKCTTPYLSQNKAVHTRWTAFCFSPFRCAILTLLQSNSLTIRDGICGQIPIPSLRSLRIPPLPPKNSTSFDLSNFFIHCESNGISSRRSRGYHHRRCISSAVGCIFFRNDDIQGFRLGDIQNFVLIIYTPLA